MTNFREFLLQQNEIYKDIGSKSRNVLEKGLKPDKNTVQSKSGYIVAFLHDNEISEELAKLSRKISLVVPSISFKKEEIHTTISTNITKYEHIPDKEIIEILIEAVKSAVSSFQGRVEIQFTKFLMNQNSIILAGDPNESFFNLSRKVVEGINKRGLCFRMPKMAHITVSRFLGKTDKRNIKNLIDILKKREVIERSMLNKIGVGFYSFDKGDYNLVIKEIIYI